MAVPSLSLPGFTSISAFARSMDMPVQTVVSQMAQGYCKYPRKIDSNIAKHPLYIIWQSMIARCLKPYSTHYMRYGGRGITIYPAWQESRVFIADIVATIGNRPSLSHSIDRINNDGNYEPGNMRWATQSEQNLNRADSKRNNK